MVEIRDELSDGVGDGVDERCVEAWGVGWGCGVRCAGCVVQAEDGIRDLVRSRGLGDGYKRQEVGVRDGSVAVIDALYLQQVECLDDVRRGAFLSRMGDRPQPGSPGRRVDGDEARWGLPLIHI